VDVICHNQTPLIDFISKLRNIPGVLSTETFIYFEIVKEVLTWGIPENWGKLV
jgi:Lrp/AsnC family transcriptional regulator for asnA, asnC and gidA